MKIFSAIDRVPSYQGYYWALQNNKRCKTLHKRLLFCPKIKLNLPSKAEVLCRSWKLARVASLTFQYMIWRICSSFTYRFVSLGYWPVKQLSPLWNLLIKVWTHLLQKDCVILKLNTIDPYKKIKYMSLKRLCKWKMWYYCQEIEVYGSINDVQCAQQASVWKQDVSGQKYFV